MHIKQLFRHWACLCFAPGALLRHKYAAFKSLLGYDATALELIADLEEIFYGRKLADHQHVLWLVTSLSTAVQGMIDQLAEMNPLRATDLHDAFSEIESLVISKITQPSPDTDPPFIISLKDAATKDRLSGGKGANLSRASTVEGVPTPDGFVVTANAFHQFIKFNSLNWDIEKRLEHMSGCDRNLLAKLTLEMQELILSAEVPPDVVNDIMQAMSEFIPAGGLIAVRSSALSEDSDISFAGQYLSELNIRQEDVLEAYKRVIAGKYCPRAVSYRIFNGLSDVDTGMAVLIIPMIESECSGVIYSKNPDCSESDETICIYGVSGLGNTLVDGSVSPAKALLSREEYPRLIEKDSKYDGVLPSDDSILELARIAMRLESFFGTPQDIEWAKDKYGKLQVLQTRQLQQNSKDVSAEHFPIESTPIVKDLERASFGVGCGEIFYASTGEDFTRIPDGAIVVTSALRPALLMFVDNMSGVISANGSRACHFASVAREKGLPVLVGDILDRFEAGQLVTVDGLYGAVFDGCVEEVLTRSRSGDEPAHRVVELYADVAPLIVKLGLTDPHAADFNPAGSRSFHDIVRYCHEMSVGEMFSLVDKRGRGMGTSKLLKSDLPLVMYILDLGNGIVSNPASADFITPQDITSFPMRALWSGLSNPHVQWSDELTHVDWEEFDRMSAGIFSLESKLLASYGIVSDDYVHLMIRFGYHFSVVDSICGPDSGANYINFRFKGGGAFIDSKLLRLSFIRRVLDHYGFDVVIRGDMLDAVSSRMSEHDTSRLLSRLGYLLAMTRLMDMHLQNEKQVAEEYLMFIARAEMFDENCTK